MTPSGIAQVVERFFAAHKGAGLILPSGWFGRPYDNFHRLTGCAATRDGVRIQLDGQLNLSLTGGELVATIRDGDLTLSGFATAVWDWRPFGSTEERHETFFGGAVAFIAPLR